MRTAIVVWRFDRFASSVSHLLKALENFRALDIEFESLSEQVDTSTTTGKMIFTVLGAVAELERSLSQGDSQVFKKYSQMKLRMKREALDKINRRANEMPGVLAQQGSGTIGFDTVGGKLGFQSLPTVANALKSMVVPAVGV